ncbi:hypothetical protein [Actinomadura roseirufa]|uniref:hypothetical protein n=1 Tax=Actinomadura roseirufa TaxID=2094049 RepID=UPI0010412790|nr:hypothetical protein [Actinomadura roseirufa]
MRFFVVHDGQGIISSVITVPDDSTAVTFAAPAGSSVSEVGDLPLAPEDLRDRRRLEEFAAEFQVDVSGSVRRAAVVRRGG